MYQNKEVLTRNDPNKINSKSIRRGDESIESDGASVFPFEIDVLTKEQVEIRPDKRINWSRLKKAYSSSVDNEEYLLKRPFDIGLSLTGILFSFPLWILIAIAIWFEDRGAPFYVSDRIGKNGVPFRYFKFRTMVPNADKHYGPLQAKENDHRITRVGKILRITAMDELPQLFNILQGDMSFVGPRPLMPSEVEVKQERSNEAVPLDEIKGYSERHSVAPGLTGIAQVFAPRDLIRKHKFRYDLFYMKKQSLTLDIKLIILSFWITFRGKWESRDKKL
ncbi:MAG: sugar transferase [Thermodesulfobacteriota bacterium]